MSVSEEQRLLEACRRGDPASLRRLVDTHYDPLCRFLWRLTASPEVAAELTHIPSWPGEHQGLLRAIYRMFRVNDLGEKGPGSAGQVLRRCIAVIWRCSSA